MEQQSNINNNNNQLLETELSRNPSIRRLQFVLDVVLREEYEGILLKRDQIYDTVSQHVQFQKLLKEDLKLTKLSNNEESNNSDEPKRILHDVGCHFYVEATLLDPRVVHMNLGCGVVVAMTVDEALKYSKKCEDAFRMRGEKLTKEALSAKYKMRLVTEAIMRLQDIQIEKDIAKKI